MALNHHFMKQDSSSQKCMCVFHLLASDHMSRRISALVSSAATKATPGCSVKGLLLRKFDCPAYHETYVLTWHTVIDIMLPARDAWQNVICHCSHRLCFGSWVHTCSAGRKAVSEPMWWMKKPVEWFIHSRKLT